MHLSTPPRATKRASADGIIGRSSLRREGPETSCGISHSSQQSLFGARISDDAGLRDPTVRLERSSPSPPARRSVLYSLTNMSCANGGMEMRLKLKRLYLGKVNFPASARALQVEIGKLSLISRTAGPWALSALGRFGQGAELVHSASLALLPEQLHRPGREQRANATSALCNRCGCEDTSLAKP